MLTDRAVLLPVCGYVCSMMQELADKKKEITNLDLESIVNEELRLEAELTQAKYELVRVQVVCGDGQVPTATVGILDKTTNQETLTGRREAIGRRAAGGVPMGWDGDGLMWCGANHVLAATGTGPVDAAYVAVAKALNIDNIKLLEFSVRRHSPADRQTGTAGRQAEGCGGGWMVSCCC